MYQLLKHSHHPTAKLEIVPNDTFVFLFDDIMKEKKSVHGIQILLNIVLFYKEMNAYAGLKSPYFFFMTETVNSSSQVQPSVDVALTRITNSIYDGIIQIPVNYGNFIYVSGSYHCMLFFVKKIVIFGN